ncbi:MAG: hypothetical protein U0169_13755 [Polyangiaceae bacterium]
MTAPKVEVDRSGRAGPRPAAGMPASRPPPAAPPTATPGADVSRLGKPVPIPPRPSGGPPSVPRPTAAPRATPPLATPEPATVRAAPGGGRGPEPMFPKSNPFGGSGSFGPPAGVGAEAGATPSPIADLVASATDGRRDDVASGLGSPAARPVPAAVAVDDYNDAVSTRLHNGAQAFAQTTAPSVRRDPNRENETVTDASNRKVVPLWMLASAAAFAGLMVVALVYAIVSSPSRKAAKDAAALASANPALGGPGSASGSLGPVGGPGDVDPTKVSPFTSLRAGFFEATRRPDDPSAPRAPSGPATPSVAPLGLAPVAPATAPPQPVVTAGAQTPVPGVVSTTSSPVAVVPAPNLPTMAPQPPPQPVVAPRPPPVRAAAGSDEGLLSVVCLPACDRVTMDGATNLGPAPFFRKKVRVGSHRLELHAKDGNVAKTISVVVTAGEEGVTVRQSMSQ